MNRTILAVLLTLASPALAEKCALRRMRKRRWAGCTPFATTARTASALTTGRWTAETPPFKAQGVTVAGA
jgi:hypothetical protein